MIKSAYIHIPFCRKICSYCDFCKQFYNEAFVDRYLSALKEEISKNYQGEVLKTIYIGGGTPSCLSLLQTETLFSILSCLKKDEDLEFTIEANVNDITEEKLILWKKHGINRLSIGVETMHSKYFSFLERDQTKKGIVSAMALAKKYFDNINIDLMYAFPKETIKELKEDLEMFLSFQIPHISIYSLILEEHTKLYFQKLSWIDADKEAKMYEVIQKTLEKSGYVQYEISNFAKKGKEAKHNLTYWNNEEYYGFGLGASGYVQNIRYSNTRSLNHYCSGKWKFIQEEQTKEITMENEMILGLRKVEGVNLEHFFQKFGGTVDEKFDIMNLRKQKYLIEEKGYLKIPKEKLYISNSILLSFIK